ncbi:Cobalt-zinc-cadmium resistance protein CzcA-like protein [Desulfamplus magnetovallimortis]|uniref:Cobalt-zinc-cadmium resistance protein CzcA-like protein n=1 Tax=Desulfamplus magnetovallimortis TaxID=1246637 RepID=A0A1W1H8Y6_9BACT|nr:efflux RND transporter permease subunit [Desulfamplus magnetovallimortis]SLM28894.1 Cobalt-zinc-cadmium resistance protein CzcA-like protein [Desulfamplus magnetovallimortis]
MTDSNNSGYISNSNEAKPASDEHKSNPNGYNPDPNGYRPDKNREIVSYKGAIPWMAGNSVAANLMMLVLLVGGLFMASSIKQEVFPDFEMGIVNISVSYPGASPEEVERGIVLAVEEAVQGLDGIKEMNSTASEGRAIISIEVQDGVDVRSFAQEVESEVKAISSFPDEAETPMVTVATRRRQVIGYAIYGDIPQAVLREIAEGFRDMLLQDPDITQAELVGIRDYEIHVEVPQENLRRYGLTLRDVANRIQNASVELPGGSIKSRGGEIMVRMKERREFAMEYARLPIITPEDASEVLLEDIATIKEGFSDSNSYGTFNGKPSIEIEVYRVGDQKPLEVAEAVKREVEIFEASLPEGVAISLTSDRSEIFRQRAELLVKNGCFGLCLVFIFLALFLEIRLAFWVALGIPISVLGSFTLLPVTDFSINVISMFAFIVTLGIVVDDAIVVGENIYSQREQQSSFLNAAIAGTKEVGVPVVFSILTNVVAFMPIMFVPGMMGKIFKVIPIVVIVVFMVSLVESLFILPAHLSHRSKPGKIMSWLINKQQYVSRWLLIFIEKIYGPFLNFVLANRYITLSVAIAILLIVGGYVKSGRITTTLMPRVESDYAYVTATLPYGSSDEKAAHVLNLISNAAEKVIAENGKDILSTGYSAIVNGNSISSRIIMTPPDIRPLSTTKVTELWRIAVGDIPGLESILFQADRGGPGSGSSLAIELSHRDIDTLKAACAALADELSSFPSTKDIDDGSARGKEQLDFKMLPLGRSMGLGARDVALQVRHAYYGTEAMALQRGRNEVSVIIRLPESERIHENSLETLIIHAPDNREVLLRDVVTMERGRAYTSIERREGRRVSTVSANVVPRDETDRIITEINIDIMPRLKQQFPGLTSQLQGRHADMRESTDSLVSGLYMALFGIYALLAIPFKSYIQPMVIMCCIPFGIVGAVLGHIMLGFSLSLMSLFGLVALSGVVVNDSLVMVDFANRKRRNKDMSAREAIFQSGKQRFRAIMLTTLTTFGGLAPMIFETSRQARFMIPMAISLGFGILFATIITLALVPTFYMVIEDIISIFHDNDDDLVKSLQHQDRY